MLPVPRAPRPVLALLALPLFLLPGGCEDIGNVANTSIEGSVVDPTGFGLDGVRIGVLYDVGSTSAPGAFAPAQAAIGPAAVAAEAVQLQNPYPNPASAPPNTVTLSVVAQGDTTARLEIWTEVGGVSTLVAALHSGTLSAGTSQWTWDGRNFDAEPVPNGLYTVRLTVPASGEPNTRTEASLLINRTLQDMKNLDPFGEGLGFNGTTGADGAFLLTDIAVGQSFVRTNASGPDPLGTGITRNQVTLGFVYFPANEYSEASRVVVIGAGDVVTLGPVTLTPLIPAAPTP